MPSAEEGFRKVSWHLKQELPFVVPELFELADLILDHLKHKAKIDSEQKTRVSKPNSISSSDRF